MSKAGVGFTEDHDSKKAGAEAAKKAVDQLGDTPSLAMIYHTAKHNPQKFGEGVRSVIGPKCNLIGGYAAGIITKDHLGYDGFQGAVATLKMDTTKYDMFLEKDLKGRGEATVGRALAKQIRNKDYVGQPGIVYMYDTVKSFSETGGFDMNIGTYLVDGMTEVMGKWPTAAGYGMIGNMQFNPTHQYFNDQILQQAAMALVFHGPKFRMDTTIFHGCKPASDYHKITKADKNVVLEIDGKPALEKVAEMLGAGSDKSWEEYPLFVTFGVNRGDKFGEYKEENYANRLCMAIDKKRKGLVMFEPDLTEGTEVQLMRRSIDFDYIKDRAQKLYDKLAGRKPFFAHYIDCAGRAGNYCGSEREEGAEIQKVIGSKIPLLGMYTGVEIGEVGSQKQQALDWSGVLCVFSEA